MLLAQQGQSLLRHRQQKLRIERAQDLGEGRSPIIFYYY